ncbi:MAG TPA: ABC transporter permease [Vicinamibacterales bacterium]|jgi:putative ABC transport system permease protein|nr:ABC transporter permease [Vicinamibacterales bacterium]
MSDGRQDRRPWRDVGRDVDDELTFHLEMRARDARAQGLDTDAARREAERRFGDLERIRREVRTIDEQVMRERGRQSMWRDLRQDVNYALRGLWRTPGFTAVALLTLAIGIGANTAIFSVVNAALLRPLSFTDPGELVFLWNRNTDGRPTPFGPGRMMDFRAQSTSFSGFAALSHISYTLTGRGDPETLPGASVSSTFFDVLGVRPLIGDTFHGGHADPNAVVLTYGLWVRRFGGDPSIVGRAITLNRRARTVVAVMPREFFWPFITGTPTAGAGPDLFVPGGPGDVPRVAIDEDRDVRDNRNAGYIRVVARLRPGVTERQADAEVRAIGARLSVQYPQDGGRTAMLVDARTQFFGTLERPLIVLAMAVVFVLAIACANVASLLLARGAARRRDLALRRALGATRLRIARQLLTEALVLSVAGAAAGAIFAWWSVRMLLRVAPDDVTALSVTLDWRVLIYAAAVAVFAGVAFGIAPALQCSRGDLTSALAEGSTRASGSRRSSRVRDWLVACQIAIAVLLVAGAALLVRSFASLTHVDTGIDTRNLLTFAINLTGRTAEYQSEQVRFYAALQERLLALPGVTAAGSAVTLPIGGDDFGTTYQVDGRPIPEPGQEPAGGYQVVMPGFFSAMGIRILEGRDVALTDTRNSQGVVLVNETLARQQWPAHSPIGKRVRISAEEPWLTVVGVTSDIRHLGPAVPPRPEIYQPASQRSFPFMAFVVRTAGDPYQMVPSIRHAVAELDPTLAIADVKTMDDHIAHAVARPRFVSALVTGFSVLALTLAVIGIYGLMGWSVAQQQREIAIRMALGAEKASVLALVLRKAAWLAGAGIAAGLAVTPIATRPMGALLFGVTPADPLSLAAAALALAFVTLFAAFVPAARAARIQPGTLVRS